MKQKRPERRASRSLAQRPRWWSYVGSSALAQAEVPLRSGWCHVLRIILGEAGATPRASNSGSCFQDTATGPGQHDDSGVDSNIERLDGVVIGEGGLAKARASTAVAGQPQQHRIGQRDRGGPRENPIHSVRAAISGEIVADPLQAQPDVGRFA